MTESLKPEFIERHQLIDEIKSGVTVITGNQRFAREIQKSCDLNHVEQGHVAWETPDILPWGAWLERTFSEYLITEDSVSNPLLLSTGQELLLWEQVIIEASQDRALLQTSATARQCAVAWRLMHEWCLLPADFSLIQNEDSHFFLNCCLSFKKKCDLKTWISHAELPGFLSELTQQQKLTFPHRLILTGFNEFNPEQLAFLLLVSTQSCDVNWLEKSAIKSSVSTLSIEHERAEIDLAARWARHLLEKDRSNRVGIVVPELSEKRDLIQSQFDRVFTADSIEPGKAESPRAYNISMGSALFKYPMIQTALQLLQWQHNDIPIDDITVVLHSPYIGGWEQERFSRSKLDRYLREYRKHDLSLEVLIEAAKRNDASCYCPVLVSMLERYIEISRSFPAQDSARNWAKHINQLLLILGFTQGRALTSEEYQTAEAWTDLLGDLVRLDHVAGNMPYQLACKRLRQLAQDRVFQPQTSDVPVQVLGVLEASSLEFDYLWVMGMHDGVWPPPPKANSFIPVALQRDRQMPHSSAIREWQVAAQHTQRLVGNATEVIISYPCSYGDEMLRPSPLIAQFETTDREAINYWQQASWVNLIFSSARQETWNEENVALKVDEKVAGGSQIFKLQSVCPFRAFAECRLNARPMTEASLGLDPAERGSLIHQVLENFWKKVKNQESLLKVSSHELEQLVSDSVQKAIEFYEKRSCDKVSARFRALEYNRLKELAFDWLQIEKQREAFTVINTEQKIAVDINDIPIHLKIDRIDELKNGGRLVIDYKTGAVTTSQWFGERPEEPQLPLYSVVVPEHLTGLLFAKLKPGESCFRGVTSEEGLIPGVKSYQTIPQTKGLSDWEELMTDWNQTINQLAEDFKQGHAEVDPLKYPSTCQYCSLTQLCRINQLNLHDDVLEDEI